MHQLFHRIATVITSLSAVITVLFVTLFGLITCTHTLFMDVLPERVTGIERSVASWLLSISWEATLIVTTCNTQHVSRFLPRIVAAASGITVLFFIEAFDFSQETIHLMQRWFIGGLVATVNYVYTELFYVKWKEQQRSTDIENQTIVLEASLQESQLKLSDVLEKYERSKQDVERLLAYVNELEAFKQKQLQQLTCPYCQLLFGTAFKLNSHKGTCASNPSHTLKTSIYSQR